MMKKFILLIIVFFYVYPIFLRALPIPLDRVLQLMGFCVLLINQQYLTRLITSRSVVGFIGLTLIFLLLAVLAQFQSTGAYDLYLITRIINTFLEFFSAFFVFWVAKWCYKTVDLGTVLYYIVLAGILQTLISAIFFINPSYYNTYSSLLNSDVLNKEESDVLALMQVRFVGVGSAFFGGVTKYGVAFFSVLALPYVHKNRLTSNGLLYWSAVLLIFLGGMLTGRTFFIAIALGVLMLSLLKSKNIFHFVVNNLKALSVFVLSSVVLYFVLSSIVDTRQFTRVVNYIFSIFINYFSGSGLENASTNRQLEMYISPDSIRTWLFGDGRMQNPSGGYYMRTDIGYVRLLFYFGLPSTIYFVYMLCRYTKILSSLTHLKATKYFFLTVLFWLLIIYFKGLASYSSYYVLFLVFLVLPRKNQKQLT